MWARRVSDRRALRLIKRLRGLGRPQYCLRIEDVRVYYDVAGSMVEILAIVLKSEADRWLAQFGNPK